MIKRESSEARSRDTTWQAIGIALAVLGMVLTVDWAARQLWHPPAPFVFPVPKDACIVQWEPTILMQNTATRTQTYLRHDGARVTMVYDYDVFTGRISERGHEIWYGGECSVDAVKGRG